MTQSIHSESSQGRTREVKRVLWMILGLNVLVSLAKLSWGVLSNSAAMTADGIHSLFDGTSNVVALIGLSIASRPADEDHPYGHAKFENYASIVIGLMLIVAGFTIGKQGVARILGQGEPPEVSAVSFVVMLVTLAINIGVATYERHQGKHLKSDILIADSSHTASDIFVSVGVIISLILVHLGFPMADAVVSLIIAVVIFYTATTIFKQADETLSDRARLPMDVLDKLACSVEGVKSAHEIRTRGTEAEVYLDMHIVVAPDITVLKGHQISHEVELVICQRFPQIVDLTIHVEPEGAEYYGETCSLTESHS